MIGEACIPEVKHRVTVLPDSAKARFAIKIGLKFPTSAVKAISMSVALFPAPISTRFLSFIDLTINEGVLLRAFPTVNKAEPAPV